MTSAAPCSLDLNPIEEMFSGCKAMLKRNQELDWMTRHEVGMSAATPLIDHSEHEKCGTPLYGVVAADANENDVLIGAYVATAILFTDNLTQILNFINVSLGKVALFTFFILFLN